MAVTFTRDSGLLIFKNVSAGISLRRGSRFFYVGLAFLIYALFLVNIYKQLNQISYS